MKRISVALLLLVGCKEITGERGSGTSKTEARQVAAFERIDVGGAFRVDVTAGAPQLVELTGDDNLLPLIATEVKDQGLRVEPTKRIEPKVELVARIASPTLSGLSASGASKIQLRGVAADAFDLSVGGAARIDASGTAKKLVIRVSGSAEIHAAELKAEDLSVDVSGSGELDVYATGVLDVNISGAGTVRYAGNPREVKKSISGAGKLEAR